MLSLVDLSGTQLAVQTGVRFGIISTAIPLAIMAIGCVGAAAEPEATCDAAVAVLAECGTAVEESPFGTCNESQRADAASVLTAYDAGGCELLNDRKADGYVCTNLLFLCVEHTVDELVPFTTDGCSMFPDGTPSEPTLWQHCCVEHDFAYYAGGMRKQRADADDALEVCVTGVAGDALANTMWSGVRVGGTPAIDTPWRWGYGWVYDPFDGYRDLPPDQLLAAQAEIDRYRANPWPVPGFKERRAALADDVASVPDLRAAVVELEAEAADL